MTRNTKYAEMTHIPRGDSWNDRVHREANAHDGYNNSTNPLPEMFRGKSPNMVNTLIVLGWSHEDTLALLNFADSTGDHPDWSEDDWDRLLFHFQQIEPLVFEDCE